MLWKNGMSEEEQQPLNPNILDTLARSNPALIERYRQQMAEKDASVEAAKSQQQMGAYGNIAGNLMNDFNNSQKQNVVLKNRMQDLGRAPEQIQANRPKYEDRISPITSSNLAQETVDRTKVDTDFKTGAALNEFETNNAKAASANDPNSNESVQAREYLKKMVPSAANYPDLDRISAAQLEKITPGLYKAFNDSEEIKAKKEMASATRAAQLQARTDSRADKAAIAAKEKIPTAQQSQTAGFGKRLEQAEGVFRSLKNSGYNRADYTSSVATKLIPESLSSSEWKSQDQAERNFVNALLRRESGAAISPLEFENAQKQYFPRAGDSEEILLQKEENRALVLASLKAEAGNAWDKIPSAPLPPDLSGFKKSGGVSDEQKPTSDLTQFKRVTGGKGGGY